MTNIFSPGVLLRLTAATVILTLTACTPVASFEDDGKPRVLATTGMVADLVRQIGGDRIQVVTMMGPGVDPHLYKPTAGDIGRLDEADLVVFGGLHLEGRMSEAFHQLGSKAASVGDHVPPDQLIDGDEYPDPHIWLDPNTWSAGVEPLTEALANLAPDHAKEFRDRAARYQAELNYADAQARNDIGQIPEQSRVIITAHDAFQYFGRCYGLEVLGIQGTNTAAEASPRRIQELADIITKRKVKAIFVESSVSPALINALIEAVQDRGWNVKLGGSLYSDSPGPANTPEETVIGMFQHNVRTIVEALK